MEATKTASCLPFGIVFICIGILVNLIQATCFLIVRPLSKTLFRRINGAVAEILWLHIIWLMDWWSGIKVQLYTDDADTYRLMGKEHAILMPNHICDADILLVWLLAQRFNCLRSALMVVKKSSKYLPIYGWASWFFEFIFLDRSWEKDEQHLKSSLEGLKDFYRPFWLTMFVEGTRMTADKLLAAQEFAASRGLPVPKNVLVPRTKGFVAAVKHMRSFVPAVYDVTLAVPKGQAIPSLVRIFERQPSEDAMLEEFRAKGTFGGKLEIPDGGPSLKSLLVYITCLCLCCVGMYKFCQAFSLLSTWKGNAILAGGLGMVVAFGHIFIEYTKLPKRALIAAAAKANMN
ncbi:hypothetical protein I3843_14G120300 [Carya illinoinensis]|nr:hypothetical protein I3760_14G121900 [Carya illinoinensis]KAG7947939.1 hypothetical protein I3843_14G120300 [Carya illinoinensis]